MAVTIHRYRYDDSYVLDKTSDKVRVDFQKADNFHIEKIDQRGDNDMGNIILNFFERDDNYNTRLGVKKEIMSKLEIRVEDLDFLVLADNEMGVDTENFYRSEYILSVLEKIERNKVYLLENFRFPFPKCMNGISEGIAFAKKATEEGDLMLFRYQ